MRDVILLLFLLGHWLVGALVCRGTLPLCVSYPRATLLLLHPFLSIDRAMNLGPVFEHAWPARCLYLACVLACMWPVLGLGLGLQVACIWLASWSACGLSLVGSYPVFGWHFGLHLACIPTDMKREVAGVCIGICLHSLVMGAGSAGACRVGHIPS